MRWWERASERLTDAASEVQVVHGNGEALNAGLRRVAQHALDAVLEARMALARLDRLAVGDKPDDLEVDLRAVLEVAAVVPGREPKRAERPGALSRGGLTLLGPERVAAVVAHPVDGGSLSEAEAVAAEPIGPERVDGDEERVWTPRLICACASLVDASTHMI